MLPGTNPIFQSHSLRTLSLTYKPPQALLMRYIRHHVSKFEQIKITQCKSPHQPSLLQYKQTCRSHTLYHKHIEFYSCISELRTSLLIAGFLKLLPFLGLSINYSILEAEPKGRHQLLSSLLQSQSLGKFCQPTTSLDCPVCFSLRFTMWCSQFLS